MEERQVTIDGEPQPLQQPFMVIAIQNSVETQSTFPLPEAQLDRFLLKLKMGHPSTSEDVEILKRFKTENPLDGIRHVAGAGDIMDAQNSYTKVYVSEDMLKYIFSLSGNYFRHKELFAGQAGG